MTLKAVLLDLDGTLLESLPSLELAYRRFLDRYGRTGSREEFSTLVGPTIHEIVGILRRRHELPADSATLAEAYRTEVARAYAEAAAPAAGAHALLDRISRLGLRAAVVSSCPAGLAASVLEAQGLGRHVEEIVDADGLPEGKPDPAVYRKALDRLGIEPTEAIAIEDSPSGVLAASRAGVRTLALGTRSPLVSPGAAVEAVEDLEEAWRRIADAAGREAWRARPISLEFKIVVRSEPPPPLPAEIATRVEAAWLREAGRRGESLRDGSLLSYWGLRGETLFCRREAYRRFVALRRDPDLAAWLDVRPIGVSGVLRAGEAIVFGRRSASVTEYPGFLELVPSGGLGEAAVAEDGALDATRQLLDELEEETGLTRASVAAARPLALVLDVVGQVYDVGCELRLRASAAEVSGLLKPGGEYETFELVPCGSLERYLAAAEGRVVPASLALLAALGLAAPPR